MAIAYSGCERCTLEAYLRSTGYRLEPDAVGLWSPESKDHADEEHGCGDEGEDPMAELRLLLEQRMRQFGRSTIDGTNRLFSMPKLLKNAKNGFDEFRAHQ